MEGSCSARLFYDGPIFVFYRDNGGEGRHHHDDHHDENKDQDGGVNQPFHRGLSIRRAILSRFQSRRILFGHEKDDFRIDPDQTIISIPTEKLKNGSEIIPAVIGTRMAKSTHLAVGDYVTVRWRDANGTFDASEIQIVEIMKTNVGAIDFNQIWVPLKQLQEMMQTPEQATLVILSQEHDRMEVSGWIFRDHDYL